MLLGSSRSIEYQLQEADAVITIGQGCAHLATTRGPGIHPRALI